MLVTGNPFTLVSKSSWSASSSGHYKNSADWAPGNLVDDKQNTIYGPATDDLYHWFQVDFGQVVNVSQKFSSPL